MLITQVEIKDVGTFEVTKDMTHRSRRYLKLNRLGTYAQIQFDSTDDKFSPHFQKGYDYSGNDIWFRVTRTSSDINVDLSHGS